MLTTISILTALAFASIYPLCFWISFDNPLKGNFHKFHIGLPNAIGGIVLISIWLANVPLLLKIIVTVWKIALLAVSRYSWKKEYPNLKLMTLPCLLGIYAFIRVQAYFIEPEWTIAFIGVLSGLIFCVSFFAISLTRWHLKVHGLPSSHLIRTIYIFWFFLGVRALWDSYFITHFTSQMDGFLLIFGVTFGVLLPIICLFYVKKAINLNNLHSAVRILCGIFCSIALGNIICRYYLVKFGMFL